MKVISKPFWRRRRVSMFGPLLSRKGQFEAEFRDGARLGVHELACSLIRLYPHRNYSILVAILLCCYGSCSSLGGRECGAFEETDRHIVTFEVNFSGAVAPRPMDAL